jgi:hypothetical protein
MIVIQSKLKGFGRRCPAEYRIRGWKSEETMLLISQWVSPLIGAEPSSRETHGAIHPSYGNRAEEVEKGWVRRGRR